MPATADGFPDFSDNRPLEQMEFGAENPDPAERRRITDGVRAALAVAGVQVADDIDKFGCTGFAAAGMSMGVLQDIRKNWAGAGHGFPCYVPQDRFCFIHNTIGGLQPGQAAGYPSFANAISRPLTAQEEFKVALVESAMRQNNEQDTRDVLAGRADFINVDEPKNADAPTISEVVYCREHGATLYSCTFCLAGELVHGALEPKLLIVGAYDGNATTTGQLEPIAPAEVPAKIKELDSAGVQTIGIYAQVVRFERKLVKG